MKMGKYDKYFTPNFTENYILRDDYLPPYLPRIRFDGFQDFGTNFGIRLAYVKEPGQVPEKPHSHDFDQYLCFFGSPDNVKVFDADVELYLGEEGEKHIINTNTIVFVPMGMIHCPLIFKRVDKPIMFINVPLTNVYVRKNMI